MSPPAGDSHPESRGPAIGLPVHSEQLAVSVYDQADPKQLFGERGREEELTNKQGLKLKAYFWGAAEPKGGSPGAAAAQHERSAWQVQRDALNNHTHKCPVMCAPHAAPAVLVPPHHAAAVLIFVHGHGAHILFELLASTVGVGRRRVPCRREVGQASADLLQGPALGRGKALAGA